MSTLKLPTTQFPDLRERKPPMKTPETLREDCALKLMREGRPMLKMHTRQGLQWFVAPGGQITNTVASRILARSDVQPSADGLFPNCDQTFRLRNNWRRS